MVELMDVHLHFSYLCVGLCNCCVYMYVYGYSMYEGVCITTLTYFICNPDKLIFLYLCREKLSKTMTNHSHYVTWTNSFLMYGSQCLTVILFFILKPSIWFTTFTNNTTSCGTKELCCCYGRTPWMEELCFRDLAFSSRCTPVWYFGVLLWAWL